MRDPFPIVAKLGQKLTWAEAKALVLLVAVSSPEWGPAADLADALGIEAPEQEGIYREALQKKAEAA